MTVMGPTTLSIPRYSNPHHLLYLHMHFTVQNDWKKHAQIVTANVFLFRLQLESSFKEKKVPIPTLCSQVCFCLGLVFCCFVLVFLMTLG